MIMNLGCSHHRRKTLATRHEAAQGVLALSKQSQAVLDDDNRAVDDDAEIDSAKAHQIGADARLDHPRHRNQHRQWNDEGGKQGGAYIAKQQE
jgi:hypothetical protein